jgi:hypothetical protein
LTTVVPIASMPLFIGVFLSRIQPASPELMSR